MKNCAWCDTEFLPTTYGNIYCSVDCREKATREKIVVRYIMNKRKKRVTKVRKCAGGCGTALSIYNDSTLCANCMVHKRKYNKFLNELKDLQNGPSQDY